MRDSTWPTFDRQSVSECLEGSLLEMITRPIGRVKSAMHRKKKGTLKSGSGRKVKSRKQAIAIGLSEARKKGAKVPRRKYSRKKK